MATGSSQNIKNEREKACWTAERHKTFVELCVEEVGKHNRVNQSFNRQGWKNIVDAFAKREGVLYDQKQMKNHFNSVRDTWKAWHKLVGQTGVAIDPITGGVLCDDQTWTTFVQANPECKDFRKRPILCVNQLDLIYEGTIATGEHSWAPSEGYHPVFDLGVDLEVGEGDAYFVNTNPDTPISGRVDITKEYDFDESEGNQNKQREARIRRRSDGSTTSKKRQKEGESDRQWSELCEAIRCSGSMSNPPPPPPPAPLNEEKFTLTECLSLLNTMSDHIPIGGLLYMKATKFLRDKLNRETWMSFPTNEVRAQWLEYMTSEEDSNK